MPWSPTAWLEAPGRPGPVRGAMADVAGSNEKFHSFSGIDTDKTVMDNLEAPCLGSKMVVSEEPMGDRCD